MRVLRISDADVFLWRVSARLIVCAVSLKFFSFVDKSGSPCGGIVLVHCFCCLRFLVCVVWLLGKIIIPYYIVIGLSSLYSLAGCGPLLHFWNTQFGFVKLPFLIL